MSLLATLLLNLMIATKESSFLDLARWSVLCRLRRIALSFGDPIVEYELCGATLHLPLSHNLPLIRRTFPLYSDNLGRIAGQLFARFGNFRVIDVGANVGDTVAIIHKHAALPILCIEGEAEFSKLLKENTASMAPVPVIEQCFVGVGNEIFTSIAKDGTARLTRTEAGHGIRSKPFSQILDEHPEFQKAGLLKIDTDGMDIGILDSAIDWIAAQKPVLFFEYDPDLQRDHDANGSALLARLKSAGYSQVLVYENNGDYMLSAELKNERLFSDLHAYFSGRNSKKYCDLCIFHGDDDAVAEIIRSSELDFFQKERLGR